MDEIKLSESVLTRLLNWNDSSESRNTFIVSLSTAMLGVLAVLLKSRNYIGSLAFWLALFTALLLIVAILFVALAILPKTKGPKDSIIYFGRIAEKSKSEYMEQIKGLTKEQYLNDLIDQCHRNSQIINNKYKWVKRSIWCLFLSIIPWFISVYLLYV